MGLFDDAEKLAGQVGGQGEADSLIEKATQEGEQFADNETGGKFDSEIEQGGSTLDQQVDKDIPNL